MSVSRLMTATCLAAGLLALQACAPKTATAAATDATSSATTEATPAAASTEPAIQPESVEALSKMGSYLRSLTAFELAGETVREEVFDNDQKLQFTGSIRYKVKRPDGLWIETAEDRQVRQFFFDGKSLTVFAPRMGYYTTVAAPPTIRELLDEADEKYGIVLPLEDLFRWGTEEDRHESLRTGRLIGYASISGQDTDQYAFQEAGIDWQVWIARGAKPLPLRIVIEDVEDPGRPQFEVTMTWSTEPTLAASAFSFKPPPNAKQIPIATSTP